MHLKFSRIAAFLLLGLSIVSFSACNDPCKDIECVNGTCSDGECVCSSGYSGPDCGTAINDRFEGVYALQENCLSDSNIAAYNVTLTPKEGTPDEFTILGLWQTQQNLVTAEIEENGTSFHIDRQGILTGYEVKALVGTISSDARTVNITYSIYQSGDSVVVDQCTASLSK